MANPNEQIVPLAPSTTDTQDIVEAVIQLQRIVAALQKQIELESGD